MVTLLQERHHSLMLHVYGKTYLYKHQIKIQPKSIANSQHESKDEIPPFVVRINKRQGNLHFQFIGNHPAARRSVFLSPLFPRSLPVREGWTPTPDTRCYSFSTPAPVPEELACAVGFIKGLPATSGCSSPNTAQLCCPNVVLMA